MAPQFDREETWKLEDEVHQQLMEARGRYEENKTPETRAAYLKALRTFTDLVVFRIRPPVNL